MLILMKSKNAAGPLHCYMLCTAESSPRKYMLHLVCICICIWCVFVSGVYWVCICGVCGVYRVCICGVSVVYRVSHWCIIVMQTAVHFMLSAYSDQCQCQVWICITLYCLRRRIECKDLSSQKTTVGKFTKFERNTLFFLTNIF